MNIKEIKHITAVDAVLATCPLPCPDLNINYMFRELDYIFYILGSTSENSMVQLCRIPFEKYSANPNITPMFKDLVSLYCKGWIRKKIKALLLRFFF